MLDQLEIQTGDTIETTNTTADTYKFTPDRIPTNGSSVRKAILNVTGTAHTLADITRVTARAGQQPFIDALPTHFAAFINYYSKGGGEWPTTATSWEIPFHGFMNLGAPRGKRLQIDHSKNATPQTGTASLNLGLDDTQAAPGYMMFTSEPANIPASSTLKGLPISQEGWLAGIALPTANVTALRVYDGQRLLMDIPSLAALKQAQNLERGIGISTTILYIRMPRLIKVVDGATKLQVSTGGSWATTDVISIHTVVFYPEVEAELLKRAAA